MNTEAIETQIADETDSQSAEGSTLSTADVAQAASQQNSAQDVQVENRPAGESAPLFDEGETASFRDRWTELQAGFVDDPQQAVKGADALVAEAIQRLAQIFADERNKLESQWSSGGDVSTEDLRVALQRYRSFFDRLLSV
jgi:hypothetical protein